MKFHIDEDVLYNFSPSYIEEVKENLRKIFVQIHQIKGWKWTINKINLAVTIGMVPSYQSQENSDTLWISLLWAAPKGSLTSPESDRKIFISSRTMNYPPNLQNVYTYHSYSDLLTKFKNGDLQKIIS
tara:strand:- start:743 stop:1126 length:384 start_codon:yes stop_codon:yes gene_type:complete